MDWLWWTGALVLLAGILLALTWRPLRRFGRAAQVERARASFQLHRARLETLFLQAASATGKPRGLRWKECQWEPGVEFARERATGQLAALVGVTIAFEAVEGGDMEGVTAVGNLRNASAVFFFQGGQWHTIGKAVFNLNPGEAIEHFKQQYEGVGTA